VITTIDRPMQAEERRLLVVDRAPRSLGELDAALARCALASFPTAIR